LLHNCTDTGDGLIQVEDEETGGDGLLPVQDKETGGDGCLHAHAGTSRTGVGYRHSTHGRTDDDDTDGDNPLPDTDKAVEISKHVHL